MALILVTHDMGVVAETAQRVSVHYAGQKVEEQPVLDLFADPHHPYTAALLAALPERAVGERPAVDPRRRARRVRPAERLPVLAALPLSPPTAASGSSRSMPARPRARRSCHYPLHRAACRRDHPALEAAAMTGEVVLIARDLTGITISGAARFGGTATLKAVDGASFALRRGETLAVVGESGCGKSTLARLVTMIEPPTRGSLNIHGKEIAGASRATLARLRSSVQIVFQNPYGSLNPRQKIGAALEEPLLVNTTHAARPSGARRPRR